MLVLVHNVLVDILAYPFDLINIVYVALVWWLIYNPGVRTNTLIIATAFFAELYSATSFGIVLTSFAVSLLATDWMLKNVFTNHSWYMVFLTGVLSIAVYRVLYILGIVFTFVFLHTGSIPNSKIILDIVQEIIFSSTLLVIVYFVSHTFSKKMNPRYISLS